MDDRGIAFVIAIPLAIVLIYKIETAWWVALLVLMLALGFWLDRYVKENGSFIDQWRASRRDDGDWDDEEDDEE